MGGYVHTTGPEGMYTPQALWYVHTTGLHLWGGGGGGKMELRGEAVSCVIGGLVASVN